MVTGPGSVALSGPGNLGRRALKARAGASHSDCRDRGPGDSLRVSQAQAASGPAPVAGLAAAAELRKLNGPKILSHRAWLIANRIVTGRHDHADPTRSRGQVTAAVGQALGRYYGHGPCRGFRDPVTLRRAVPSVTRARLGRGTTRIGTANPMGTVTRRSERH
jgi:hypothetical protein